MFLQQRVEPPKQGQGIGAMLDLVISIVGLAIPVGILLPFRFAYCALFKWSGGWRIAGILPLFMLVAFFAPLTATGPGTPPATICGG